MPLLEKAFAKLQGAFSGLSGSSTLFGIRLVSQMLYGPAKKGWSSSRLKPETLESRAAEIVEIVSQKSGVVSLSSNHTPKEQKEKRLINQQTGLVDFHGYGICGAWKNPAGVGCDLLKCCNTWGKDGEWNGAWSDGAAEWEAHPEVAEAVGYSGEQNDGVFFISTKDLCVAFKAVWIWDDRL